MSSASYSFLYPKQSMQFGGPDEDFTGRELMLLNPQGEVLGTAVLVEQLASAGYSHVYKCYISGGVLDGQMAAAKVLTTGYSHTAARAEPLLKRLYDRELAALTQVHHRHVIGLVGVGEINTVPDSPPDAGSLHGGPVRIKSIQEAAPMHDESPTFLSARQPSLTVPAIRNASYVNTVSPFLNASDEQLAAMASGPASGLQPISGAASLSRPVGSHSTATSTLRLGGSEGGSAPYPQTHLPHALYATADDVLAASSAPPALPPTPIDHGRRVSILFSKQSKGGGFGLGSSSPNRWLQKPFNSRRSMVVPAVRRVLFLEWMPGGDTRTLIDQAMRPMTEPAAATIILPILQALCAAHKAGIVHRDVKAGNILLAPGPREVRLADWGISVPEAESSARLSGSGGMVRAPGSVGTEYWCAPEIELGLAHDASSDVFSLAITFIELITGKDPRYDNSAEGFRRLTDPSVGLIPDDLSPEAAAWLLPCLSCNPAERPTTQAILDHPYFVSTLRRMEEEEAAMEAESEEEEGLMSSDGLLRVPHHQAEHDAASPDDTQDRGSGQIGADPGAGGDTPAATRGPLSEPLLDVGSKAAVQASGGEQRLKSQLSAGASGDRHDEAGKRIPLCGCSIA